MRVSWLGTLTDIKKINCMAYEICIQQPLLLEGKLTYGSQMEHM